MKQTAIKQSMINPMHSITCWTSHLSEAMLTSLSESELQQAWNMLVDAGELEFDFDGVKLESLTACNQQHSNQDDRQQRTNSLRSTIESFVKQHPELQPWLINVWRETHPDLVMETEYFALGKSSEQCQQIMDWFPQQEIAMALITDPFDDGLMLAKVFGELIADPTQRDQFESILKEFIPTSQQVRQQTFEKIYKVAIFGGHPRDESKLEEKLFGNSPYQVQWMVNEKKSRGGRDLRTVSHFMASVDAAIMVTGMISHTLMKLVKQTAIQYEIPYQCVEKATEFQLIVALELLFPPKMTTFNTKSNA